MSGAHTNLEGKVPITLGTIPLANVQAVPNADVPVQPTAPMMDPSSAPTQPVSPASPQGGWNLYPSLRKFQIELFLFFRFILVRSYSRADNIPAILKKMP